LGILGLVSTVASITDASARGGGGHGGGSHSGGGGHGGYGTGSNSSSHSVKGYSKRDGTYVQPHHQTNSNSSTRDNYGTRGNVNPYTGKVGTKSPKD
jgi:hypothetical protein